MYVIYKVYTWDEVYERKVSPEYYLVPSHIVNDFLDWLEEQMYQDHCEVESCDMNLEIRCGNELTVWEYYDEIKNEEELKRFLEEVKREMRVVHVVKEDNFSEAETIWPV